jgi:hypothetical protein
MKKRSGCTGGRPVHGIAVVMILMGSLGLHAQQAAGSGASAPPVDSAAIQALADSVRQLQAQVQTMQEEMRRLQTERDDTRAELSDLRRNFGGKTGAAAPPNAQDVSPSAPSYFPTAVNVAELAQTADSALPLNTDERVARLEENEELAEARLAEHSQTKVESGSKYRVRLSGIILLNMFSNRGNADSIDIPQIAEPQDMLLGSRGSFGGTLRQSIIGLDVFGPQIAGAHTSASVKFDFAGGFPYQANGVSEGLVRLRTATIRLDWKNTSLVAGQDALFFVPVEPTSLASLAVPPLSYAGNLWAWTPQVRLEHRITLAENSTLSLQGGIMDNLTGVTPQGWDSRYPSWGEQSGHPAYATRIALGQKVLGQNMALGFGGFYGRENWGLDRNINDITGTVDLTLPLGRFFGFTGFFYRGHAVAGLGGGIGQSILWSGNIMDPLTVFHGLRSEGGWAQLKFTPRPKFEINGGFGQDNPFASDLRRYGPNGSYTGSLLSRNQSPFANFIYRLRSDVMFSLEYRHLNTTFLDAGSQTLHHVNAALAYTF